jgi:hypothetical protein
MRLREASCGFCSFCSQASPRGGGAARGRWGGELITDNIQERVALMLSLRTDFPSRDKKESKAAVVVGQAWDSCLAQTLVDMFPTLVESGFSLEDIAQMMGDGEEE